MTSTITTENLKKILLGTEHSGQTKTVYDVRFSVPYDLLGNTQGDNSSAFSFGITGLIEDKFTGLIHQNVSSPTGSWLGASEFDVVIDRIEILKYTNYQNQTTEYDVYNTKAKDAIEKLGGMVATGNVIATQSSGQDYSLVKSTATTSIGGTNYLINDVMDTLESAATATATFINDQVQDGIKWLTADNSAIQLDLANWLAGNLGNLINGQMSLDAAFISLAKYVALHRVNAALANSINNVTTATSTLSGIFKDAGVTDQALADKYAGSVYTALSRMAVDFAFNSQGWGADQYVKVAANDNCINELTVFNKAA